jgi:hypothetical protein
MSLIKVELTGQGRGTATGLHGEKLDLVSSRAFAPGQPLTIRLAEEQGGLQLQGKSLGSKRRADDQFEVRVRLINLSRSTRERLSGILSDSRVEDP